MVVIVNSLHWHLVLDFEVCSEGMNGFCWLLVFWKGNCFGLNTHMELTAFDPLSDDFEWLGKGGIVVWDQYSVNVNRVRVSSAYFWKVDPVVVVAKVYVSTS